MFPHERSLVKQLADQPFALIGVNSDTDREKLKDVLKAKNISWRSFWNGGSTSGPISTKWNVHAWPTIYVLDKDGVIRYKNVRGEAMDKALMELFDEMSLDIKITHDEEGESEPDKPKADDSKDRSDKGKEGAAKDDKDKKDGT